MFDSPITIMKFALVPLAFAAVAFAAPAALETRQTGWCVISNKVLSYGTTERFLYNLVRALSLRHERAEPD